ncbi:MAG: hypothetical protein GYB18_14485 [Oceanospirillales bacterium]|nr:hypothetical protein [Oceanospirillales bacterium]
MNIETISFTNLIPFTALIEKHVKSPTHLKECLVAGIRKQIHFYAVNQSDKYVHMVRWDEIEIDHPPFHARVYGKEKKFYVGKGKMLPLAKTHQFDKLFKGVLNEIDLFEDIGDLHELVEYQQRRNLFYEHAGNSGLTSPIEFNNISYGHIFIEAKNLEAVEELLKVEKSKKLTKQDERELVFIDWLKDKDEQAVSNMKKDDVWEELRKINPHLFVSGPKAFFRAQQIITFKPGRKVALED